MTSINETIKLCLRHRVVTLEEPHCDLHIKPKVLFNVSPLVDCMILISWVPRSHKSIKHRPNKFYSAKLSIKGLSVSLFKDICISLVVMTTNFVITTCKCFFFVFLIGLRNCSFCLFTVYIRYTVFYEEHWHFE